MIVLVAISSTACTASSNGGDDAQSSTASTSAASPSPTTSADDPEATSRSGERSDPSPTVDPTLTSVVLATEDIPAGTTGQEAIDQGLVKVEAIPERMVPQGSLAGLDGLENKTFTAFIARRQVIIEAMLEP